MNNTKNIIIDGKSVLRVMKGGQVIWPKYDPATVQMLKYADDNSYQKPSDDYILKLDDFIKQLKGFDLWGKMDFAYWMVGDSDMNFKCINIINPEMSGTPVGGLINTLQGIEGNRIDGYIETGFNHLLNSVKQTVNDAGRSVYLYRSAIGVLLDSISGDSVSAYNLWRGVDGYTGQRINSQGAANPLLPFSDIGFKSLNRISLNTLVGINNLESTTASNASIPSLVNSTHRLFYSNGSYSLNGISMYSLGSAITGQDAINYRQAILDNL